MKNNKIETMNYNKETNKKSEIESIPEILSKTSKFKVMIHFLG